MNQPASLVADLMVLLDPELRYQFEERAGIMEFDGGVSRDDAECLALVDLLRTYPDALTQVAVFRVELNGRTQFVLTTDVDRARDRFDDEPSTVRFAEVAAVIREQFGGIAFLSQF